MTAGGATAIDRISPDLPARAVIMNLNDGTILWQIQGDGDAPYPGDFDSFAWNRDGTTFFGKRNSRRLPANDQYRLYRWSVGTSSSNAIVDNVLVTGGSFQPIFNNEMTEAYARRDLTEIHCYDMTQAVTSVNDSRRKQYDTVYPNPTNGSVTLPWQWPDTTVYWQLLSISGQIVTYGSAQVAQGNIAIDLSHELASGRYALIVRDASASHVVHQTVIKN